MFSDYPGEESETQAVSPAGLLHLIPTEALYLQALQQPSCPSKCVAGPSSEHR